MKRFPGATAGESGPLAVRVRGSFGKGRGALRRVPAAAFRPGGYTLVELMIVMVIIIVLVSLVFPLAGALKKKRTLLLAQAELKQVEAAIQAYKAQLGFYPPDNPGNPVTNQLYFELSGTVLTNRGGFDVFATLDGDGRIQVNNLSTLFGGTRVVGFANSSRTLRGTDEKAPAINFVPGLRNTQVGRIAVHGITNNALLISSVKWPLLPPNRLIVGTDAAFDPHAAVAGINPWRYVSSNPPNNPGSYDLWIDVVAGNKIYRVSNWSREPQVVGTWP